MRRPGFIAKVILVQILSVFIMSASAQAPIIFRVNDAVKPGELVTVYGEGLAPSGIEVVVDATSADQPSGSSTMLEVVSPDPEGHYVTAIMKETLPAGVYKLWVKNATGWSNAITLNAARPQWLSIDQVAAGLKVKVVGRNLDGLEFGAGRSTRVKLVNGASEYNANVLTVNPYAAEFTVSASVPHATYDVLVSNNGGGVWKGLESDQMITVVQNGDDPLGLGVAWAKDFNWSRQYNVKDYGAVGDGTTNETAAIQAAVDAVKTAGGGVVYFPVGTYKATAIQLPAGVVLLGESRENSVLSFANSTSTNFIFAKNDGITSGRMGIANLKIGVDMNNSTQIYPDHFISFGNPWGSDLTWVGFTKNRTAEKIFVKDVTVNYPTSGRTGRANILMINAHQYVHINGIKVNGWKAWTANMISKYSEISDCHFEATDRGVFAISASMYTVMERNSIKFNNSLTDKTVERGYEVTSHSYIAYNSVENSSGTDNWNEQILIEPRDGITKMYGTVNDATSTTVTVNPRKDGEVLYGYLTFDSYPSIAHQNNWSLEYNKYPQGWYITITDGKGLGQYRKVVSLDGTTSEVGIDKPWNVVPDNTSKFVISVPALNNVAYKNTMKNGSKPLLGYQNVFDNVFADNYAENTQGYNITNYYVLSGGASKSRFSISYFNRMVNNTTKGVAKNRNTNGVGYHFDMQLVDFRDEDASAYTCYGMDIKNNYVQSSLPSPQPNTRETPPINGIYLGSYIRAGQGTKNSIKGATIENNIIRDSNRGISIGGTLFPYWTFEPRANTAPMSYGIVVKSNRFMNVTTNIVDNTTTAQKTVFIDNGEINDQTPPVTNANISGNMLGDIYIGDVTMEFTATDSVSGVKSTEYSLDLGVTWKTYELPVVFTDEGSYVIRYRSADRVENLEQAKSLNFTIGSPAGEVTETFDTDSSTTANGWMGSGNKTTPNNYGWAGTDEVLGEGTGGAAGGVFARSESYSYFADTNTGTFDRTDTLRLAGSFRMVNDNFDGNFYLGYFDPSDPGNNFLGLGFAEPSGGGINPFRGFASVNRLTNSTPVVNLPQDTTLTFDLIWTGNADGSGTLSGTLAGQSVSITAEAGTGTFTAFGLLNGGLGNSSEKTGNCYFDNLAYRTLAPPPPTNLSANVSAVDTSVTITWDYGSELASGFVISRDGVVIGTVSTNTFTDHGVVIGTTYQYSVHAYNEFGNSGKATLPVFVGAPVNLSANVPVGGTSVTLTWDYGSGLELGFVILRDGVAIDTALTKTFTDRNVVTGTTYEYSVYAYNVLGNSGAATVTVIVGSTAVHQRTMDEISIYPNPATDIVYFRNVPEDSRIVLVDLTGRSILEKKASGLNGGLSLQPYASGYYMIRVIHRQEYVASVKVLKK